MLELPHSICLHLTTQPDSQVVRSWFKAVKRKAPSGVPTTVEADGKHFSMIKRKAANGIQYCIPLTRALTDDEVQEIIHEFIALCDRDMDFDVFSSSEQPDYSITPDIELNMEPLMGLCTDWAKHKHDGWMKDKLAQGWQYGTQVSFDNKTHPLLRQWADLPDQYKDIDDKQPHDLVRLLNDNGYVLLAKEELDKLLGNTYGS